MSFVSLFAILSVTLGASLSMALPSSTTFPEKSMTPFERCADEKRAIVVGASVSLGFYGPSPALVYLERAGFKRECIMKKTIWIGKGRLFYDSQKYIPWLKTTVEEFKPHVIVALDFLFHDISFLHSPEAMPKRFEEISSTIAYLESTGVPVVIGSVFALPPNVKDRPLEHLNDKAFLNTIVRQTNQRLCTSQTVNKSNLVILPVAKMFRQIYSSDLKVVRDGKVVTLKKEEVLADWFHVGPRGAALISNRIINYLNELNVRGSFPFAARPLEEKTVFKQKRTFKLRHYFDNYAHEVNLLFTKFGNDTMPLVGPATIPPNVGDEACPPSDGFIDSIEQLATSANEQLATSAPDADEDVIGDILEGVESERDLIGELLQRLEAERDPIGELLQKLETERSAQNQ